MVKVFVTPRAQKDTKEIPEREKSKIKKKLSLLEDDPQAGKKLFGELAGFYSLRVWPYRIIYFVKENSEVWIVHILHRQGAYK